jgi:hypothetical protein
MFTRQFVDESTEQEIAALAPWPVQLWLVYADCEFYYSAPTTSPTVLVEPRSVHVPANVPIKSTVTLS